MNSLKKQLSYFNTFINIIQVWGDQEIGNCEVDVDKLSNYLSSLTFFTDTFELNFVSEFEENITQQLLNGFPVWNYLKISDWTKNMVSKSFKDDCEKEKEDLKKQFICLRDCKYYNSTQTEIGLFERCSFKSSFESEMIGRKATNWETRRDCFELKRKCKNYERE